MESKVIMVGMAVEAI